MGQTYAGDIPGGVHFVAGPFTQASRASNAADSTVVKRWVAPAPCTLVGLYWIPTEGDQTAHATNHHVISVLDGGAAGAGTAVIASSGFTASVASEASKNIGSGTVVLDAGDFVNVKFATAATASSTGKLFAGEYFMVFKYA